MSAPSDNPKPHLAPLTGVRFIAALWVIFFHLTSTLTTPLPAAIHGVMSRGYLGVDLFFCLSGFILAYIYCERFTRGVSARAYADFLVKRLARIYPLHVAVLALWVAAVTAQGRFGAPPFEARGLLESITLVHAWGASSSLVWNGPSWSISAEWGAYLLFPLLALRLGAWPRSRGGIILGVALSYAVMGALLAGVLSRPTLDITHDGALLRIAGSFIAGMLIFRLRRHVDPRLSPHLVWGSLGALALAFALDAPDVALVPLFAPLLLGLSLGGGRLGAALAWRPIVVGGEVSYALYLIHTLVITVAYRAVVALRLTWGSLWLTLPLIAAMLIAAWVLHRCVENPARDLIIRRALPQRAPASADARG